MLLEKANSYLKVKLGKVGKGSSVKSTAPSSDPSNSAPGRHGTRCHSDNCVVAPRVPSTSAITFAELSFRNPSSAPETTNGVRDSSQSFVPPKPEVLGDLKTISEFVDTVDFNELRRLQQQSWMHASNNDMEALNGTHESRLYGSS